jgi:hypothetical protein
MFISGHDVGKCKDLPRGDSCTYVLASGLAHIRLRMRDISLDLGIDMEFRCCVYHVDEKIQTSTNLSWGQTHET